MIRLQYSFNLFLISTITCQWLLIFFVSTSNASQRYPYVLPKCCDIDSKVSYEVSVPLRGSGETALNPCSREGSEVILLPKQFFPAMSTQLDHVEVQLKNWPEGLNCDEGIDESEITLLQTDMAVAGGYSSDVPIEPEDLEPLTPVNIGTVNGFDEFSFSADNLLVRDGIKYSQYGPAHFCILNGTANKTRLDMKTCKQKCSSRRPCIPRCCGGHQSILTSPPTSSTDSFLEFCSTPALDSQASWSPWTSNILEGMNNGTVFYQTRYIPKLQRDEENSPLERNCRLIFVTENPSDNEIQLTFLEEERLRLTLDNTSEVLDDFCIDGINQGARNYSNVDLKDNCQAQAKHEAVVVYTCSSEEHSSLPARPLEDEVFILPSCSCLTHQEGQLLQLPLNLFPERENETREAIPVKLTTEINGGDLQCPEQYEDFTVEFKDVGKELFSEDGSLISEDYSLDPTQFCILSVFHNAMKLRVCKEECSIDRPCINRCCSGNTHIDIEAAADAFTYEDQQRIKCETPSYQISNIADLLLYTSTGDTRKSLKLSVNLSSRPLIRKRRPYGSICFFMTPNRHESLIEASPYKLMENGDLMAKVGRRRWEKVNLEDYCIEPFMRRRETGELELSGDPEDILVWRCWRGDDQPENGYIDTRPELLASLYFVFSVFYVGIAVVFILRKDKDPIFRWSVVCWSISMTLTYCLFGYVRISFLFHERQFHYFTPCAIIGMLANFIYLNGFSWITALSFDIWFTLTFLAPGKKSRKRLFCYIAFTFTFPTAIVGTGIALDIIYLEDPFSDVLIPQYGVQRCLFEPGAAALPYLYGPLAVLTTINILFFFATVVKLWNARHSSKISKSKNENQRRHGKTFLLYFKLFLLMGIPWVLETLTWVFTKLNEPYPAWAIGAEIVTLMQPLYVFFFLVWNADTRRYLGTNYPKVKGAIDFIDGIETEMRLRVCSCYSRAGDGAKGNAISSSRTNDTTHSSGNKRINMRRVSDNPV